MTEGDIKSKLVKKLRDETNFTITRHEDKSTAGIPDIEVTGNGVTTWWEVKYGRPGSPWKTKGIQHLHLLKLAAKGRNAWYIIFEEAELGCKIVSIVHPRSLGKTRKADRRGEWTTVSRFDYDWVVGMIVGAHSR